jgi:hypothetical protein
VKVDSPSSWSKTKLKSHCNFEKLPYVGFILGILAILFLNQEEEKTKIYFIKIQKKALKLDKKKKESSNFEIHPLYVHNCNFTKQH